MTADGENISASHTGRGIISGKNFGNYLKAGETVRWQTESGTVEHVFLTSMRRNGS